MATSLKNVGNEYEITNHENTAMDEKMKLCLYDRSYGQFCAILAMKSKIQLPCNLPCKFQ